MGSSIIMKVHQKSTHNAVKWVLPVLYYYVLSIISDALTRQDHQGTIVTMSQ